MTTETQQHTPTPWVLYHDSELTIAPEGRSTGAAIAYVERGVGGEANAAFIVQACNAYHDLLAALQRAVEALESHNDGGDPDYDWVGEVVAAIAKATGPQVR